jgi:NADH dehydrogenase
VFRPSYIFGAGDEFLSPLIHRMVHEPFIEVPGHGEYRLQPISVDDAARAILAAIDSREAASQRVIDLVGPEILSYRALLGRLASIVGRGADLRERPVGEALALARASGYFGLRPHDLACLLCDEVSDPGAVESLVEGPLETVDQMLRRTVTTLRASGLAG